MRFLTIAIIFGLLTNACSMRFSRVEKSESLNKFFAQIEQYNKNVEQLKSKLDIRASGVMGAFVHEQADVIARAPKYFLWSLRSFFGPPNFIVASNGEFLTVYDFSGATDQPYQKIPLKGESVFQLLDFQFHPQSLITLFLAKIPVEDSKNIEVNRADNTIEIVSQLKDGWQMKSLFDHERNLLLETRLSNPSLGVTYQATYANFEEISRIYFPRSFVLIAKHRSRFVKLNIEHLEIELNGEKVLSDAFYLESH